MAKLRRVATVIQVFLYEDGSLSTKVDVKHDRCPPIAALLSCVAALGEKVVKAVEELP